MQEIETTHALQNLIRLQELQVRQSELRGRVEQTPKEIACLDEELAEKRKMIEDAEAAITHSSKERRITEAEVEDLRQKLSHYREQLMEVKTNTAYQAMLHEIQFVESGISEKEDFILEQMLESDELDRKLVEAKRAFQEEESVTLAKKKELEALVVESDSGLQEVEKERARIQTAIPGEFLARYQRIAAVRDGIAVTKVVNHSCEACHVRLRPQLLAELRANRRIILCENCNRILYYSDA
jgi:predicted  nucleic acid-binding Zn-ribbon protein